MHRSFTGLLSFKGVAGAPHPDSQGMPQSARGATLFLAVGQTARGAPIAAAVAPSPASYPNPAPPPVLHPWRLRPLPGTCRRAGPPRDDPASRRSTFHPVPSHPSLVHRAQWPRAGGQSCQFSGSGHLDTPRLSRCFGAARPTLGAAARGLLL